MKRKILALITAVIMVFTNTIIPCVMAENTLLVTGNEGINCDIYEETNEEAEAEIPEEDPAEDAICIEENDEVAESDETELSDENVSDQAEDIENDDKITRDIRTVSVGLDVPSTICKVGESILAKLILAVDNEEGAILNDFVIEIIKQNSTEIIDSRILSGLSVENGQLFRGGNAFVYLIEFIPFDGENDTAILRVNIRSCDENSTMLASAAVAFEKENVEDFSDALEEIASADKEESESDEIIEEPTAEEVIEKSVAEENSDDETVTEEEPVTEELVSEEPAAEEVIEEPVAEENADIETVTEEEPVTEEPLSEESAAEEVIDEPVAEENADIETVTEEEAVMGEPAAEEVIEEPVAEEYADIETVTEEEPVTEKENVAELSIFDDFAEIIELTGASEEYLVEVSLWAEETDASNEMIGRALKAGNLDSIVFEDGALIYVRTGKQIAIYDASTGLLIDIANGIPVAVYDVVKGYYYPIYAGGVQ